MSITRQSSDALAKRLAALPAEIVAQVRPAIVKSVEEGAADARTLAEARGIAFGSEGLSSRSCD